MTSMRPTPDAYVASDCGVGYSALLGCRINRLLGRDPPRPRFDFAVLPEVEERTKCEYRANDPSTKREPPSRYLCVSQGS